MTLPDDSPFQAEPPSGARLWRAVLLAMVIAAVLLVVAVLPAEFGIDPTGLGARLGLARMGATPESIALQDTLGGNEAVGRGVAASAGQPLPLPNPRVHQPADSAPKSATIRIRLPVNGETEVKAVLAANKVMLYSWQVDRGVVYVDYHGHSPDWADKEAFVRYQEAQDGLPGASGSLVAPFTGEHGWYWVNITDHPVEITLNVSGYFDEMKDYGLL